MTVKDDRRRTFKCLFTFSISLIHVIPTWSIRKYFLLAAVPRPVQEKVPELCKRKFQLALLMSCNNFRRDIFYLAFANGSFSSIKLTQQHYSIHCPSRAGSADIFRIRYTND